MSECLVRKQDRLFYSEKKKEGQRPNHLVPHCLVHCLAHSI